MKLDVNTYAEGQADASSNEEVSQLWRQLSDLYSKRLWHQLTSILQELVKRPEVRVKGGLMALYTNVIADFENKLNPLCLIELCIPISESLDTVEEALKFIENVGEKVKGSNEAYALSRIVCGKNILYKKVEEIIEVKKIIDQSEGLLNEVAGVGKVHREFYKLSSDFYRKTGNHSEYYQACLRFLGCSDLEDQSPEESKNLAVFLSLAALLGEKIFNFGELLAHPVLEHLKGSADAWLIDMLVAFNKGDVNKYKSLKKNWGKQPDLQAKEMVLYEKLCLLALMDMTFERSSTDRQLTFSEISEKTELAKDKIELLVMKALSGGLIRGQIDQVNEEIHVTWVHPRVLDKSQISILKTKIENWSKSITVMEHLIQNNASDILTS